MKSLRLYAAVFGALVLASPNAGAATDSASFRVSLRIAAPCDVSTVASAPGRERVTVSCQSPSTPYRLEAGAVGAELQSAETRAEESDGVARMTLTF
jgi:hypothetical protein